MDVRCSRDEGKDKPSPVKLLESAVATRRRSQTELSDLRQLLTEKSARQAALEIAGDLHNPAVLSEISRLQTLTALLPRRIAAKEEDDLKAEQALTHATNQFIHEHLAPRVRQLAARTQTIVQAELSPHFPDPAALILAVAGSERVRHIATLDYSVTTNPDRGAIAHSQSALKSWSDANKFETDLESTQNAGGASVLASRA